MKKLRFGEINTDLIQVQNRNSALHPKKFMARGQEYNWHKKDPIFTLSQPVPQGEETSECMYCLESFKSFKQRRWCEFCGQNMCQKCSRRRVFPVADKRDGSFNHGDIDLLCLKKFHIQEMVESAQSTCKIVEQDIKVKQVQMESTKELLLGGQSECAETEYLKSVKELEEQKYQMDVTQKQIEIMRNEIRVKAVMIKTLHDAGNIK